MAETNKSMTLEEETKRLKENPLEPNPAPVYLENDAAASNVPTPNVPTAPIVENVANEEVSVG